MSHLDLHTINRAGQATVLRLVDRGDGTRADVIAAHLARAQRGELLEVSVVNPSGCIVRTVSADDDVWERHGVHRPDAALVTTPGAGTPTDPQRRVPPHSPQMVRTDPREVSDAVR